MLPVSLDCHINIAITEDENWNERVKNTCTFFCIMNKAEADLKGACTVLCGEIDGDWMKTGAYGFCQYDRI
jgi:hypothetical protein